MELPLTIPNKEVKHRSAHDTGQLLGTIGHRRRTFTFNPYPTSESISGTIGNLDKSYKKHGISPNEAEEIFLDIDVKIETDVKHAQAEDRYIAIGKTFEGKILFVVFTMRNYKIRVISARIANKKERKVYEKTKTNSQV